MGLRLLHLCACLFLFPLFAFIFCAQLVLHPAEIPQIVFAAAILELCVSLFVPSVGLVLLGAGTLILPFFGRGAVGLLAIAFVLAIQFRSIVPRLALGNQNKPQQHYLLLAALIWIVALLSSLILSLVLDFDALIVSSVLKGGGPMALREYLAVNRSSWFAALDQVASVCVAALLMFSVLRVNRQLEAAGKPRAAFNHLYSGVGIGAIICSVVTVLQVFDLHPLIQFNRGGFWMFVNRYSGTLSDPNALGIVSGLMVPFLLLLPRRWGIGWLQGAAILLLSAAVWSGSRTLVLMLVLWCVVGGFSLCLGGLRRRTKILVLGVLAGVFTLGVGLGEPTLNQKLQEVAPVPTIARTLQTMNWSHYAEMLSSRQIFWKIAVAVWQQSPIVGTGLGRFTSVQGAVASKLDINLGDWRDNANNFYLQILAEQGVLGFLALALMFFYLVRALKGRAEGDGNWFLGLNKVALLVLAIAMITGPHIEFDEVLILAAMMVAGAVATVSPSVAEEKRAGSVAVMAFSLVFIPVYLFFGLIHQPVREIRGFYALEQSEDEVLAWTAGSSEFVLCDPEGKSLTVRALNPDLTHKPVWLSISVFDENGPRPENIQLKLTDSSWRTVNLEEFGEGEGRARIKLEVDRTWSPAHFSVSNDVRWLGVQIKWPETDCNE